MSDSIAYIAQQAEARARGLRAVAEQWPDATMEHLWDGGPPVPVVRCDAGRARAELLQAAVVEGRVALLLYFELSFAHEAQREDDDYVGKHVMRVYYEPWGYGVGYLDAGLSELRRGFPEAYGALVKATKR